MTSTAGRRRTLPSLMTYALEFAKQLGGFLASNEAEEISPDVKARLQRFVADL